MGWEIKIIDIRDFQKFILGLDKRAQARLARMIDLLQENGVYLRMPYAKKINNRLYELRILGQDQIRVIYSFNKNQIIILNWFYKKTNKIPVREIETAMKRLASIL
jgi:phage-related protein